MVKELNEVDLRKKKGFLKGQLHLNATVPTGGMYTIRIRSRIFLIRYKK